jgi:hypothetical protein
LEFVLNLISALFHTKPPPYPAHRPVTPFDQLVWRSLHCLLNLIENGSFPPDQFDGDLGAFLNQEMESPLLDATALACDIWAAIIERGNPGDGVEIDVLLNIINKEDNLAGRRALYLLGTILRLSPISQDVVQQILSADDDEMGLDNLLEARCRNFDSLHAVALCLKEIWCRAGHRELNVLVSPTMLIACIEFLELDDLDCIGFALHAMSEMVDYLQGMEDKKCLRDLIHVYLEMGCNETILELTSSPTSPEVESYAERLLSLVQESAHLDAI